MFTDKLYAYSAVNYSPFKGCIYHREQLIFGLYTLRKLAFDFLSHWMGYDCDDSFLFAFEPNEISFDSKSKGKLSSRPCPVQFERKSNASFLSV